MKTIFCTLGPASLNKEFLFHINKKVNLVRLNLSHIEENELESSIKFIKKYTDINICIDTEGAQIRTKTKYKKLFKINEKGSLKKFNFYPDVSFKKGDVLEVGFDNLIIKFINENEFICISSGLFETNKGVYIQNRKIKLNPLTKKDLNCLEVAKKFKINNFALSFTNEVSDMIQFEKLLPNTNRIYKLETKKAIENIDDILKKGKSFLIDRGDLSKEIKKENIPTIQRYIINKVKRLKDKKIYVATNHLESMIDKSYPTAAELNDIYSTLEMGANGIVLAAETAIGKNPFLCVDQCIKIINVYETKNKK
jgi:pyruvate kinase